MARERAKLGGLGVASFQEAAQQALLSFQRSLAGLEGWREEIGAELGRATRATEVDAIEKRLLTEFPRADQQRHIRLIAVYQRGKIQGVPAADIVEALNPEAGKPIDQLKILGGALADSAVELAAKAGLVSEEDYKAYRKEEGLPEREYPGKATKTFLYISLGVAALLGFFLLKGKS